ncbi:MAG TPA: acyltransferase domain-containing protein, partial [Stellaceae bacterium]|nr:acyltransferase domain-containing protein [Stellaceae bacterium]
MNVLLSAKTAMTFSHAHMLAPDGRCKTFDAAADGYVRGEGGGAVILKTLAQALAHGDRVRAVIHGTGVNSDGRTVGLSLPSEAAQAALLRAVGAEAGITADDLAFFEMHGTGTPAGDPIEAAAVGRALGQGRDTALPIGSVKSNIGHLEPASGMAGLIKAALALERELVPASLHCEMPNPAIPFAELNLRLIDAAQKIAPGGCAGINSFGFGGTNAHAVLSAAPPPAPAAARKGERLPPLVISARGEASLRQLAQSWHATLAAAPAPRVPSLLRAAARRRDHHPQRLVISAEDIGETCAALAEFVAGNEAPAVVTGTALRDGKTAFVFAGNGAQWPGMGRDAYQASAAFRAAIAEADGVLRPALGWSVAEMIAAGAEAEQLARADVAQPLLFAIQVGIVTVLRGIGVDAAGHVGHSVGEIAAAWGAGALSLADAARVVVARSRQQERTRGEGRMAALALGGDAAGELLSELGGQLEIGAINASQAVTVSGPGAAIERLGAEARRRGIAFRALDLDFAFHSGAMDPIREDLLGDLAGLTSAVPQALLISTVTGGAVGGGALDALYWWRNIRHPVRFADALAAMIDAGFRRLVEIGPHPVLQSYLHDALRTTNGGGRVLATLARRQGSDDPFPALAARCHAAGCDITSGARFDGPVELDGLPLYPWQRERFWFARTIENNRSTDPRFEHPLLGFRQPGLAAAWLNHLDPAVLPWLADHAIEGVPVLPAAAIVEMALAAAQLRRPEADALDVLDLELRRPVPFDNGRTRELRATMVGEDGDWELASRPRLTDEPLTVHAVARLVAAGERTAWLRRGAPEAVVGEIGGTALYRLAARLGLDYGPKFRVVRRVQLLGERGAIVELDTSIPAEDGEYVLHPALLDGALQGLLALLAERAGEFGGASLLPWRFGRVRATAPFGRRPVRARIDLRRIGTRSAAADIVLFDTGGEIVAELSDCWFRRVALSRRDPVEDSVLRIDLVPAPLEEGPSPAALGQIADIVGPHADLPADAVARAREQSLLFDALAGAIARQAVLTVVDA